MTDVFHRVRRVIATVAKIPESDIRPENPVTGLANVDSIVLLEVVARTEIELGIEIDEEALFSIATVGEFVTACEEQLAEDEKGDNDGTTTQTAPDRAAGDVLRA
jgi:acyl carrier protein